MKRKICIISGTRAEFGLLTRLMMLIKNHDKLELQIILTGMHLSPEFGLTYKEVEEKGFKIDSKVEMLLSSDTDISIAKSMGIGMIGFADSLQRLNPDIIVILGDRFEIFSVAATATALRIPVAHIHGGELTEGAFDDSLRHSITKMSHIHFVAAEEYRNRVIQLGEQPSKVFNVGGMGVDSIKNTNLLSTKQLESSLGLKFGEKNLLIAFHPITLEETTFSIGQLKELLCALDEFNNFTLIFTIPNADTGGRKLAEIMQKFTKHKNNCYLFKSLGHLRFLSCLSKVDAIIGNSSSGLLEAPTLKTGTINIGDRQKGRLKADSVIDCDAKKDAIIRALKRLDTEEYKKVLKNSKNPYGNGGACELIVNQLANISIENILKKNFYDIN